MKENDLRTALVKSAAVVLAVILLFAFAASSPGSLFSQIGAIFGGVLTTVQLGFALLVAVVVCMAVLTGIFLGAVALFSRESAAAMYHGLRARLAEALPFMPAPGPRAAGEAAPGAPDPVDELRAAQQGLDGRLRRLEERLGQVEESASGTAGAVAALGGDLDQVRGELASRAEALESAVKERGEGLEASLRQGLDELGATLREEMEAVREEAGSAAAKAAQQGAEAAQGIAGLEERLAALEGRVEELAGAGDTLEPEIQALRKDLDSLGESLRSELDAGLQAVKEEVERAGDDAAKVRQAVDQGLKALEERLGALTGEVEKARASGQAADELARKAADMAAQAQAAASDAAAAAAAAASQEKEGSAKGDEEGGLDENGEPRIFAYFETLEGRRRFIDAVTEAVQSGFTHAQTLEYVIEELPDDLAKVVIDHPSLTKDYIRACRKRFQQG